MELQHLVTGQQDIIGEEIVANGSVPKSGSGSGADNTFTTLRKLFEHHKERDEDYREAMVKNAEMQEELEKYRKAVEIKKDGKICV